MSQAPVCPIPNVVDGDGDERARERLVSSHARATEEEGEGEGVEEVAGCRGRLSHSGRIPTRRGRSLDARHWPRERRRGRSRRALSPSFPLRHVVLRAPDALRSALACLAWTWRARERLSSSTPLLSLGGSPFRSTNAYSHANFPGCHEEGMISVRHPATRAPTSTVRSYLPC